MADKPVAEAMNWINLWHKSGAKRIGVTCNPVRREIYLRADDATLLINATSQFETRVIKDILHDHIASLTPPAR